MDKNAAKILLISDFLSQHRDDIEPFEYDYLRRHIGSLDKNFMYYPFVAREIYDKLGLMKDDENLYHRFAEFVRSLYDITDMNILEVGGGIYPTLAERICTQAGKVTVYDPRLAKHQESTNKLVLVRKNFNRRINLDEYDLVVSLMPCKGAEAVLDACVEQDKDFVLGLCEGGPHGDCFDFYEDEEEWITSMVSYADARLRRNGTGKLLTKKLEGCSYPYPVVYNSRK